MTRQTPSHCKVFSVAFQVCFLHGSFWYTVVTNALLSMHDVFAISALPCFPVSNIYFAEKVIKLSTAIKGTQTLHRLLGRNLALMTPDLPVSSTSWTSVNTVYTVTGTWKSKCIWVVCLSGEDTWLRQHWVCAANLAVGESLSTVIVMDTGHAMADWCLIFNVSVEKEKMSGVELEVLRLVCKKCFLFKLHPPWCSVHDAGKYDCCVAKVVNCLKTLLQLFIYLFLRVWNACLTSAMINILKIKISLSFTWIKI